MRSLTAAGAGYPRALLDLRDPPDPVWVDGDGDVLSRRAVSIVGTRRLTPYGARVARELAIAFASAGFAVVSGLAQGIDSAAHEGALEAGGVTVAVLGAGVEAFLAGAGARRRALARRIRATGALVSEFPPDAPAQTWTFAKRDATIAALGELTIVVEAPADSGALITAEDARRLGRAVYAVPGPLGAGTSVGTNTLIAEGRARAVTSVSMVLDAVGARTTSTRADRDQVGARILEALAAAPADPDTLARRLGLRPEELATAIVRLAMSDVVIYGADGRLARR
jgi:DNA processing protein